MLKRLSNQQIMITLIIFGSVFSYLRRLVFLHGRLLVDMQETVTFAQNSKRFPERISKLKKTNIPPTQKKQQKNKKKTKRNVGNNEGNYCHLCK